MRTGRVPRVLVLAALLLGLGFGFVAAAQTPATPLSPDEFRAALLSKIPQYVTWPARALGPDDRELVIALLGGGAFTNYLEPLVRELRVGDRPVVIRTIARLEELPRCQILFFPAARTDELAQLPEDRREGLLTVGEGPGFTRLGGVFLLSPKERTLTVNARNARIARLELQSRLLRIAAVER